MKAVVLDITGSEATVMTHAGDIIGINNLGYEIGQEITIEDKKRLTDNFAVRISRFMPAVAAAAAVIVILGGSGYVYYKPYGTVSLDVNPSIEYTINRLDRVLDVNGVNDDGSEIISELDIKSLKNKDIETAIEETITQIEADGYMEDEDGNYVVVTANTGRDEHTDRLIDKLDRTVAGHKGVEPIAVKVSADELNEAHRQGVSAGKKVMVDRLSEVSGEAIDREEWNRRSVKEIVKEYDRIKDGGKENKPSGNGDGQYPGSNKDGRDDREIQPDDQRMIKDDRDDQEGQQGDSNGQQNESNLQTDERDRQLNDPGGKQGGTGMQKNDTDGQQWNPPVQQNGSQEQLGDPSLQQNGSQGQPGTPPLQPGDSVKQPDGPAEQPNSGDGYGGQADPNREDGVRTQEGTGQVQEDPGIPQGGSEPSWNEGGDPREDGGLLPDDHSRTRSGYGQEQNGPDGGLFNKR